MAFVFAPLLSPNAYWAFAWLALSNVAGTMVNGPQFAVLQTLVPERMRATSIALVYLVANLVGMGLGPWAAGALSDVLKPSFGDDSLRYAMLLMSPGFVWSAWYLWVGAKTVTRDVKVMQSRARNNVKEEDIDVDAAA